MADASPKSLAEAGAGSAPKPDGDRGGPQSRREASGGEKRPHVEAGMSKPEPDADHGRMQSKSRLRAEAGAGKPEPGAEDGRVVSKRRAFSEEKQLRVEVPWMAGRQARPAAESDDAAAADGGQQGPPGTARRSMMVKGQSHIWPTAVPQSPPLSPLSPASPGTRRRKEQQRNDKSRVDDIKVHLRKLLEGLESVYTPEELAGGSDDLQEADEDKIADLLFESPGRRRRRSLTAVVAEGRSLVLDPFAELNTKERVETIKSLADWLERRAPLAEREDVELEGLEAKCTQALTNDDNVPTNDAGKNIEVEVAVISERLHKFYQHLKSQTSGEMSPEFVQEKRREAMGRHAEAQQQYQATNEEKEAAAREVAELQAELDALQREEDEDMHREAGINAAETKHRLSELEKAMTRQRVEVKMREMDVESAAAELEALNDLDYHVDEHGQAAVSQAAGAILAEMTQQIRDTTFQELIETSAEIALSQLNCETSEDAAIRAEQQLESLERAIERGNEAMRQHNAAGPRTFISSDEESEMHAKLHNIKTNSRALVKKLQKIDAGKKITNIQLALLKSFKEEFDAQQLESRPDSPSNAGLQLEFALGMTSSIRRNSQSIRRASDVCVKVPDGLAATAGVGGDSSSSESDDESDLEEDNEAEKRLPSKARSDRSVKPVPQLTPTVWKRHLDVCVREAQQVPEPYAQMTLLHAGNLRAKQAGKTRVLDSRKKAAPEGWPEDDPEAFMADTWQHIFDLESHLGLRPEEMLGAVGPGREDSRAPPPGFAPAELGQPADAVERARSKAGPVDTGMSFEVLTKLCSEEDADEIARLEDMEKENHALFSRLKVLERSSRRPSVFSRRSST